MAESFSKITRTTASLLTDYARHQFEGQPRSSRRVYSAAIEVQLAAIDHLAALLDGVDVVATPTLGFIAPQIREDGLS